MGPLTNPLVRTARPPRHVNKLGSFSAKALDLAGASQGLTALFRHIIFGVVASSTSSSEPLIAGRLRNIAVSIPVFHTPGVFITVFAATGSFSKRFMARVVKIAIAQVQEHSMMGLN